MDVGTTSQPTTPNTQSRVVVALYATTLFLSAFLLFTVELIVAKAVLPAFGGVPMVWNTCMTFFQTALLAGYLYGHRAISWIGVRRHGAVYAALVAMPLLVLPFATQVTDSVPVEQPALRLILVLVVWVGAPFFVLSTSAVVLQKNFSTIGAAQTRDPYFLYAASNVGSLLALVAYPVVIEPRLSLSDQSRIWAVGYAAFVVAVWACLVVMVRQRASAVLLANQPTSDTQPPIADRPLTTDTIDTARRVRWVALAFVPSSLMLAVTTYLSTDIASVPLLWTVPLSIYLLTFVVAFGSRARRLTAIADWALPLVILPMVLMMVIPQRPSVWMGGPVHLIAFGIAALLCHGQLAEDRPPPASLTEFYFWMALGGMLGGLFNTLAAPLLFNSVAEYPLVLVCACLLRPGQALIQRLRPGDVALPALMGSVVGGLILAVRFAGLDARVAVIGLALPAFVSFTFSRRQPRRFALSVGAMLLAGMVAGSGGDGTLYRERTFFGVYRVALQYPGRYRAMVNGTTLHGMQSVDPARSTEPLTYFGRSGPFGIAFAALPSASRATDVAVVGLGIGSLAPYALPHQRWTFFELDPAVERIARDESYFTYLRACGDRCRVVLGDARMTLARQGGRYDLIVLDAFSSDAIPVHLLTNEAFGLYLSRLREGGVLAMHVSNRHLDLAPVVARLAARNGLTIRERVDTDLTDRDLAAGRIASNWLWMARRPGDLGPLMLDARWFPPLVSASTPLWTDDSSSILSVLRLR